MVARFLVALLASILFGCAEAPTAAQRNGVSSTQDPIAMSQHDGLLSPRERFQRFIDRTNAEGAATRTMGASNPWLLRCSRDNARNERICMILRSDQDDVISLSIVNVQSAFPHIFVTTSHAHGRLTQPILRADGFDPFMRENLLWRRLDYRGPHTGSPLTGNEELLSEVLRSPRIFLSYRGWPEQTLIQRTFPTDGLVEALFLLMNAIESDGIRPR
jgi:hypothetical protein